MDGSPLVKLPPEIRNNIYELVLKQTQLVVLEATSKNGVFADWRLAEDSPMESEMLALTKTCHHVHDESKQLFFAINTFELRLGHSTRQSYDYSFEDFCMQIGEVNASALRSVVIDVERFASRHVLPSFFGEGQLSHTLSAIIGVVQRELQMLHKTCSVHLKFGIISHRTYHAVLNLQELSMSWETAVDKLRREVVTAQCERSECNALRGLLHELALCREMTVQ